jgi:hypothetical protein
MSVGHPDGDVEPASDHPKDGQRCEHASDIHRPSLSASGFDF